jgi:hypothetical protein
MISKIHIGPERSIFTGFFDNAKDVEEDGNEQGDPAEDSAMRTIVKWWIYRKHR